MRMTGGNKYLCLKIQRDPELCVEGELDMRVWNGRMCTIHHYEREVTRIALNVGYVPKDWNLSVLSHATVCYIHWRLRSYRESGREWKTKKVSISRTDSGYRRCFPEVEWLGRLLTMSAFMECMRKTMCTLTARVFHVQNQDSFLL